MSKYWFVAAVIAAMFIQASCLQAETLGVAEATKVPSLTSGCSASLRWYRPAQNKMLFVNCGGRDLLVTHPNNLSTLVKIETPKEAVEYVRFFTSQLRYFLFSLDGMVEIVRGDPYVFADEHHLKPEVFDKLFKPLTVEQHEPFGEKVFTISRTVVLLNQKVYRTTERLWESGYYKIVELEPVVEDCSKIGISHLGV